MNNKLMRVILMVIIIVVGISGLSYGISKLYKHYKNANLNKKNFTKEQISEEDYFVTSGLVSKKYREEIENELQTKFNEESEILDKIDWAKEENHYLIYSMLKKEFTFKVPFPELGAIKFGDSEEIVKYFGLDESSVEETFENVEALFYNTEDDFAVKIKTVEGEELLLYKTKSTKSFEEIYNDLLEKSSQYNGRKTLEREKDKMKVPFIKVNAQINYDELCNRYIKGTEAYIEQAIQTVDFELDNYGGYVKSEAMINMYLGLSDNEQREFFFIDDFILFMKEEGKDKPYFALRVNNTDVLVNCQ